MRIIITKIIVLTNIFSKFAGFSIFACKFRITPFPSKLKTATPKNNGN